MSCMRTPAAGLASGPAQLSQNGKHLLTFETALQFFSTFARLMITGGTCPSEFEKLSAR